MTDGSDTEYKYEGATNQSMQRHGHGKAAYTNGDSYEGTYQLGKRHGNGVYNFLNGAQYDGEWNMGKKEGRGFFTDSDGSIYDGEWQDDKRAGHGKYVYPNGDHYIGEWRNHVRHGHGKYFYATSGLQFHGEWSDGKRVGDGEVTRASLAAFEKMTKDIIYYRVTVNTGEKALDHDAKAFIILFGELGDSKEFQLEQQGSKVFEVGSMDDFVIESKAIGAIQHVRIRHDNAGSSPGWFIESITVQDLQTYAQYQFACNQWLDAEKGDGAVERLLDEASVEPHKML